MRYKLRVYDWEGNLLGEVVKSEPDFLAAELNKMKFIILDNVIVPVSKIGSVKFYEE